VGERGAFGVALGDWWLVIRDWVSIEKPIFNH